MGENRILTELPLKTKLIDWDATIGMDLRLLYNDNIYEIKIIDTYKKDGRRFVTTDYNNHKHSVHVRAIITGHFGGVLGLKYKFKYSIGDRILDDKRDLTIISSKRTEHKSGKYYEHTYKYKCNRCGFDCGEHYRNSGLIKDWHIKESDLNIGQGCPCCCHNPQIVVPGINDIPTTAPWMVKYFQGGYDEAKKYTKNSTKRIYPVCPDCGRINNNTIIQNINRTKTINCACKINDGVSFSEKFIVSVLEQLGIEFTREFSSKNEEWCGKYRYDFYIPSLSTIIESHGMQHYNDCSWCKLDEVLKNDIDKKQLAKKHNVENYVVIDCRYSNMEYIKSSILNSGLIGLINLSEVDWRICEKFALGSLVKEVCDYWNQKKWEEGTSDLAEVFGLTRTCILNYIKKGAKIGWCDYDPKEEILKGRFKGNNSLKRRLSKPVEVFKSGISFGEFESATELERQSEELFGDKLSQSKISLVCLGKKPQYKGYTFKYIENNQKAA